MQKMALIIDKDGNWEIQYGNMVEGIFQIGWNNVVNISVDRNGLLRFSI